MKRVLSLAWLIIAFAFAQQNLSDEPKRFAQDMIGQLGGLVVACPTGTFENKQVMCVNLERGFEDFQPEWDNWTILHLATFGGTLKSAWKETENSLSATYGFPGYLLVVNFYIQPKDGPTIVLVQVKQ